MKDNRMNAYTAGLALVAAVVMAMALSFAIGKWSLGNSGYTLVIKFPNATGINANSEVKFAGAHAGRVKEVRLIPRKDQTVDKMTNMFNCVEVVVQIDKDIEVGDDVVATIKQDGFGIAAKYVLLTPGPNHDSPALADNAQVQGEMPFDLSDLIQPAGEALVQAKSLVAALQPIVTKLDGVTDKLDPLMVHADKFILDGDNVIGTFNTPDSRERINNMMLSLGVATENLKVVSSNAKALTATLADKPWRVFWGGGTVAAPSEADVLKSNTVIRLKPDVDVHAAAPSSTRKSPQP